MEVFFPAAWGAAGREFQCRDAATGALKWSLSLTNEPATFPAVADVDGDAATSVSLRWGAACMPSESGRAARRRCRRRARLHSSPPPLLCRLRGRPPT